MLNVLGVILAAIGAALAISPVGWAIAASVGGVVLLAGAVFLVIDWDGQ